MSVSVIIPVKDDPPIVRCIESVLGALSTGVESEVLVVDNGSAADFRAGLETLCGVRILDEAQPGAAAARNAGIAAATGDVLLFTDADCVVDAGWVVAALEGLEATGADVLRGSAGGIATTAGARLIEASFDPRSHWAPGRSVAADTKNMAVRRDVFEGLHFNPESLRGEDSEFGRHAIARGFQIAYWPAMRVEHEHEQRLETFLAKRMCGGWVAERTNAELAALYSVPGRRRRLARAAAAVPSRTARGFFARALVRGGLAAGSALTVMEGRLPRRLGGRAARLLGAWSFGVGGFLFLAGLPQPPYTSLTSGAYFRRSSGQ